MSGVQAQGFDKETRERVRGILLRYMENHGIGVPTLQKHIARATDRDLRLIPLKTLQRFLAGRMRTNDAMLAVLNEFTSTLPAASDGAGFQDALAAFFHVDREPPQSGDTVGENAMPSGVYAGYAERVIGEKDKKSSLVLRTGGAFDIPYSHLSLDPNTAPNGGAVREIVFNPAKVFPYEFTPGGMRHLWKGGVVRQGKLLFFLLKNELTREPKTYWLQISGDGQVTGYGQENPFSSPARGYTSTLAGDLFQFRRIQEGD